MRTDRLSSLLSVLVALGALTIGATAADAVVPLPFDPVVTEIPRVATENISAFRATAPKAIPKSILNYGAPDPATGLSVSGVNGALARPAFSVGHSAKHAHFWLIPAASNRVAAVLIDRKDPASFFWRFDFAIDDDFLKHGEVGHSAAELGSSNRTRIRAVVPDSIKSYKVYWKRPGRSTHVMTYKIHNNVIIRNLRNAKYFVVAGVKYELQVRIPPPPESGE